MAQMLFDSEEPEAESGSSASGEPGFVDDAAHDRAGDAVADDADCGRDHAAANDVAGGDVVGAKPELPDGDVAEEAGGSTVAAVMTALGDVDELDADATLAESGDVQLLVNLAQARQLRLAAHWADLNGVLAESPSGGLPGMERLVQLGGDGTPMVAEFAPAELAARLGLSPAAGMHLLADALDVRHRLPRLWRLLCSGEVRVFAARRVADTTRRLSRQAADCVDATVARYATRVSAGRLDAITTAAVMAADPAAAQAAAQAAKRAQGVWVGRKPDSGTLTLVGRAAAPDVEAFDAAVTAIADALTIMGDPDPVDARRAKALGVLASTEATRELLSLAALRVEESDPDDPDVDQTRPGRPRTATPRQRNKPVGTAVLCVHLSEQALAGRYNVARVEDLGPILVDQVKDWLGHRNVVLKPVIDVNRPIRAADAYEVPADIADAVYLRSPADCFPHATSTSRRRGDLDHTTPYVSPDDGGPPGQTRLDNLGRLSRLQHRIKTHGQWKVKQLRSGVWLWTSPHGYHYLVDYTGTIALGKL